jgi:hypothetical protein
MDLSQKAVIMRKIIRMLWLNLSKKSLSTLSSKKSPLQHMLALAGKSGEDTSGFNRYPDFEQTDPVQGSLSGIMNLFHLKP